MAAGIPKIFRSLAKKANSLRYGRTPVFFDSAKQLPRLPRDVLRVEMRSRDKNRAQQKRIKTYLRKDKMKKGALDFFGDPLAGWTYFDRSLKAIQRELRFNLARSIKGMRAKRLAELSKSLPPEEAIRRSVIRVMDLGCGNGAALGGLKRRFGESISTTGLVLDRTPGENYAGVDRLVKGDFTTLPIKGKFDIVYSSMGATHHTMYSLNAVQKVIDILSPNGIAVVDLHLPNLRRPMLRTLLLQNGYREKDYSLRELDGGLGVLVLKKRQKKLPA
jgi:SAM-dependent methyltransferase